MTKQEFSAEFKRLVISGYRLPPDMPEDAVMAEWYDTFAPERADDLAESITALKRMKSDTFWPSIGEVSQGVMECKKARARSADRVNGSCGMCHGEGWVDMPDQTHHGLVYRNYVARCPRCRPGAA